MNLSKPLLSKPGMPEMESYDFGLKDVNVKILKKTTGNVIKANKCNQCETLKNAQWRKVK